MSQTDRVLDYLRTHPGGLTALEAVDLGFGMRLAARIADIKDQGLLRPTEHLTVHTEKHNGGTHARYVLVDPHRAVLDMPEWYAFQRSEHKRHGHQPSVKPVPGCEWCIRMAAMDAVFRGHEVAVVEDVTEPDGPTLWGDAA